MCMKYYHLSLKITPYMQRSYRKEIVISEDPLAWYERSDLHTSISEDQICMTQYREISEKTYKEYKYRNPNGPSKRCPISCMPFPMNKRDYFGD